jgi:multicomponent Na+:H+ antiporter subunit E
MTRKWPLIGCVLAVLWLFVRGVALEPTRILAESLSGLLVGLPIAYTFRRLYLLDTSVGRTLRASPYAALYALAFLRELLVANLQVAGRVLHPRLPIAPAVIELPLRVRTDAAITSIANSITLTPGTLTLDHDPDRNVLYVHALAVDDPATIVEPIRRWEDYALVIFDERLKPGDPPPSPARRVRAVEETQTGGDDDGD